MTLSFDEVCANLDELAKQVSDTFVNHHPEALVQMVHELESLRKLAEGPSEDLISAHYGYLRAKHALDQIQQENKGGDRRFWLMFVFEGAVLSVLVALWVLFAVWPHWLTAPWFRALLFQESALTCAWWGAVGAVLYALYVLYESKMQGTLTSVSDGWLCIKPITGALVGIFVWLAAQAGLAGSGQVQNTMFLALLSFFAGWSERSFLTMLQQKLNKLGTFTS